MNPITLKDLIEYHGRMADKTHGAAVGWGGVYPGSFESRETHRFHTDAVAYLTDLNTAGNSPEELE